MWLSYRRVLAIASVLVFFTGAGDYLFIAGLTSIPPLYWIVAFAGLALPLAFIGPTLSVVLGSPVTRWCGFYAGFTIVAFMWSSQSTAAWGEVRLRILAVLFLGAMMLVFGDARVHRAVRITLLWSVVLGVALNVVDLASPLTFSATLGRSAGFHVNPNISAIALVLGMIMSVELLPRPMRAWFVCLVGGGVLLTFSRGGAAAWGVATILIVALGGMQLRSFLTVGAGSAAVAVAVMVVTGWWEPALQVATLVSSDALERLRVGTDVMDPSAEARLDDAKAAWQMFLDRPFIGWGVGATAEWDRFESTHNMYLRHLAEYGVAGLVIIPSLVLGVAGWGTELRTRIGLWLGSVVLVWSVFSHNLLDERHFLVCIALTAGFAQRPDGKRPDPPDPVQTHASRSDRGAHP